MHLRKTLTVAAAVLAAGLLGLTATANATGTPVGAPVSVIEVNGNATAGTVGIDGIFKSGSAAFAGSNYGCSGGTVSGTIARGPVSAAADFSFTTMNITCNTPVGNATISVNSGCAVTADFPDQTVNTGLLDTGAGPKYYNVDGTATFPNIAAPGCVKVSALGGLCSANVVGSGIGAQFNEATKVVGGVTYQDLILNGTGSLLNQMGCLGLLTGTFTLNNIDFNVKATAGGTIDFR